MLYKTNNAVSKPRYISTNTGIETGNILQTQLFVKIHDWLSADIMCDFHCVHGALARERQHSLGKCGQQTYSASGRGGRSLRQFPDFRSVTGTRRGGAGSRPTVAESFGSGTSRHLSSALAPGVYRCMSFVRDAATKSAGGTGAEASRCCDQSAATGCYVHGLAFLKFAAALSQLTTFHQALR
jgi:hypothetical protein